MAPLCTHQHGHSKIETPNVNEDSSSTHLTATQLAAPDLSVVDDSFLNTCGLTEVDLLADLHEFSVFTPLQPFESLESFSSSGNALNDFHDLMPVCRSQGYMIDERTTLVGESSGSSCPPDPSSLPKGSKRQRRQRFPALQTMLEEEDDGDFHDSGGSEYVVSDDVISSTSQSEDEELVFKDLQKSPSSNIVMPEIESATPDVLLAQPVSSTHPLTFEDVVSSETEGENDILESSSQDSSLPKNSSSCEVTAMASSNTKTKRVWDKPAYCCFCKTKQQKLPRHLERQHAELPEVAKFLALPKKSEKRMEMISAIRDHGYFQYNSEVLKTGKGNVIPKKRPPLAVPQSYYLPCEFCGQLYSKSQLARHSKSCKKNTIIRKGRNRSVRARSALLLPSMPATKDKFSEHILSRMNHDDTFHVISHDKLIIGFGQTLWDKYGHEARHHRMIADKCREMGRFMLEVKKIDPAINGLTQLMNPTKYQIVKQAVRAVAGFNEDTNTFRTPSLALKIGHSLKKCAYILKGNFMEDDILRNHTGDITAFVEILEMKWSTEISTKALRTLEERKWNAPKRTPLAADITLLNKYLLNQDSKLTSLLTTASTTETYEALAEIALCRVLTFNRRRVGEVQYMKFKDFINAPHTPPNSDVLHSLSPSEKALTTKLRRIEIRGKRGRKVPVILTEDMQSTLNLLTKKRKECGVSEDNPYLFASTRNALVGHFFAHNSLRKAAVASGAKFPQNITSTRLRKHVATMIQLLNLREHELDAVATFMGHDIRIHREFYRLQEDTVQLAKISKVLINMDQGKLTSMKNKNLDDITIDDEEDEVTDEGEEEEDVDTPTEPENVVMRNEVPTNAQKTPPMDPAALPPKKRKKIRNSNESAPNQRETKQIPLKKRKTQYSPEESEATSKGRKRKLTKARPWSAEEKTLIRNHFSGFITLRKTPQQADVLKFLEMHGCQLNNRSWSDVKWCVRNSFLKKL